MTAVPRPLEGAPVPLDDLGPERLYHYYAPTGGWRAAVVVDTTRFGMSGGGVRMAPDLTLGELSRLARAMTLKYALLEMPIGGAKAGIWLDPAAPARADVITAFLAAIRPLTESGAYFPAADMGTSAADFESVYGGGDSSRDFGRQEFEGMPLEDQLTGYGVVMAARAAYASQHGGLAGARVALEGFGKVGAGAAKYFAREGARVVAVSTVRATLHAPDGLDVDALLALRQRHGDDALARYAGGTLLPRAALYAVPADILVPGARPDALRVDNADAVQARWVVPAANIPYADGAVERLHARGVVALPDFVANAGGVLATVVGMQGGSAADAFATVRERIEGNVRRVLAAARERGEGAYPAAVALAREWLAQFALA